MNFNSELAGASGESGGHDMPIVSSGNAATSSGDQVIYVTQTHRASTTTSIVYANASGNDAQSSAFLSEYDAAEINMIAGSHNDSNSSDHHFDWDTHMENYVIRELVEPIMRSLVEPTVMDVKQESSPSSPSQNAEIMEAESSTLGLEVPMTFGDRHAMEMRPFEYIPPEMMVCSPDNCATMSETLPTVFATEPADNYSTTFGSAGWNELLLDSLTSPSSQAAYQQVPMQTSSDQQSVHYGNLASFGDNVQPMNMQENPPQREMNNGNGSFVAPDYNQIVQSLKTDGEPNNGVEHQENPPQTPREVIEAENDMNHSFLVREYNRVLESIKVEMEGDTNITVDHELNGTNMRRNPPHQREMNQVNGGGDTMFPEFEYRENTSNAGEHQLHQVNQAPMNFNYSNPPMHQSQQAPLESQEILGRTFATFNIGDCKKENLFIAPTTPYSSQVAVSSPCGSYSDSGFSSSQFSSQEVFSSQENENVFTTIEVNEAYDEVDGSPPMQQPVASQNISIIGAYYIPPMSVPVPNPSTYYDYHDQNTSDENGDEEEEEAPIQQKSRKRGGRSRKASKRRRVSRARASGGSRAATGTSNSECGSSDGDNSTGRPATQRPSAGGQRATRTRVKEDLSSFRHLMGPHLRTLSAVLEMSGLKLVHDLVPYEVIRRFHPTDVYRTIARCITVLDTVGSGDSSNTDECQPDWENFVATSNGGEITTMEASNDRIYYKSPFGRPDDEVEGEKDTEVVIIEPCTLSIRSEAEINGRLAQSPEVKTGVGSAELNVKLNLHKVAEGCTNVEFKQSELYDRPLVMRLKNPRSIAIVYDTGKIIVIGTKSYDEFRVAVRKFARIIQKTGVDVQLTQLKMHFHIGLFILPFDINVKAMISHKYLSKFLMHDIDIFPGVIIKVPNNPMLCLVFETGAVIFTNAVQASDMKETLDVIYPTLRLFGHKH